ncbi:MAG: discoidin domain-containing protein [Anaerolineae bacterium]
MILIVVLASWLFVACVPGTASQAVEFRPLDEVSPSGPPRIVDITDTDAVLVFESGVPLACAVVYGTTTDYGQISVDQDMGGGAHTDHRPLMHSLEPDTEYHYRVQGTAADGTFYVGEDATFRTLPISENAPVNLASLEAGASVTAVSSNFGGAANDEVWGANNAIDGNRATAWSSDGDGDDAFIEIALAGQAELNAVEVWTRSMGDGTAQITAFTLTTDTGDVLGPFELDSVTEPERFDISATTGKLRLDVVQSSGGNTGLVEFAVYGVSLDN